MQVKWKGIVRLGEGDCEKRKESLQPQPPEEFPLLL